MNRAKELWQRRDEVGPALATRPYATLAAAAGVGAVIGWWLKRRG